MILDRWLHPLGSLMHRRMTVSIYKSIHTFDIYWPRTAVAAWHHRAKVVLWGRQRLGVGWPWLRQRQSLAAHDGAKAKQKRVQDEAA